jgi:PIN domain nuclease of toxin-antitoxin system
VKLLLDTRLILWAFDKPEKLSRVAVTLITDEENEPIFSAASIWEIAIKSALQKRDFSVDPSVVRRGLLNNGYTELPVTSEHAMAVYSLPPIHKDPFDRLLIAQSTVEGITLLTVDRHLAKYPGPIRKV